MRTEARLTYTGLQGNVSTGLVGSWAAGAVLVTDDGPARFERIARPRGVVPRGAFQSRRRVTGCLPVLVHRVLTPVRG